MQEAKADVCLFLEGTYPYVSGGVSKWTHDLILSQPHLTFYLACILAPDAKPKLSFDLPKNVIGMTEVYLQKLPPGSKFITKIQREKLFFALEAPLANLQRNPSLASLNTILCQLNEFKGLLGIDVLLNSFEAWQMIQRMYLSTMEETSFLDYFWSWRGLLGGFYSIMLADLPEASIYHTLCTGYAGLFLARAFVETGRPCLTTEHGIYTNERRIEIIAADWLADFKAQNLNVERSHFDRDLKDFWIDIFVGYSLLTYEASKKIVTLYTGNKEMQVEDKADPEKIIMIPNGVNYNHYSSLKKNKDHPPTIALIGRVVPIKDIKSFLYAVAILKSKIPQLHVLIMGTTDEDEDYYQECVEIVKHFELEKIVIFTGKVSIDNYLPNIDLLILSSISEAQPLSLLEGGAAGIPCVATNVGACPELIYGLKDEQPSLGQAGLIAEISNPESLADCILTLLTDQKFYKHCCRVIQQRVKRYYNEQQFYRAYHDLYELLLDEANASVNKHENAKEKK